MMLITNVVRLSVALLLLMRAFSACNPLFANGVANIVSTCMIAVVGREDLFVQQGQQLVET